MYTCMCVRVCMLSAFSPREARKQAYNIECLGGAQKGVCLKPEIYVSKAVYRLRLPFFCGSNTTCIQEVERTRIG